MVDISDIQAQVDAAAHEVEAAISESEAQLEPAYAEASQFASEVQAKREEIAEMESNPLPAEDRRGEPSEIGHGAHGGIGEEAFHRAELSHQLMHTIENVSEQIHEHRHHAKAAKEVQWFYVEDGERAGPVSQSKLLQLLEQNDLAWDTLVWNKKLEDWVKASDTELVEVSEGPPPPPLPPPVPGTKKQTAKGVKCKGCGRVNAPNDRFCAGCGKPLRKSSK